MREPAVCSAFLPAVTRLYFRYAPWTALKAGLWRRVHWREHNYRTRTLNGAAMEGTTADLIQRYIYYFGVWEPNLTEFIKERLNGHERRVFVDIGANVGYFSLLAGMLLPEGQVIAIEAFPSIHEKLVANIRLNSVTNVVTVQCAASDKEEELELFHPGPTNEGATTLLPGRFASANAVRVRARPMSAVLEADQMRLVRLLKIDVEGAEAKVVRGMKPLLSLLPADAEIVVEVNPEAHPHTGEIFETMREHGFNAYHLDNSYDADAYLFRKGFSRPVRLLHPPTRQSDIVFSRTDAGTL